MGCGHHAVHLRSLEIPRRHAAHRPAPLSNAANEAQASNYFVQHVTAGANARLTILPRAATTGLVTPSAGQDCRLSVGTGKQSVWKSPSIAQVPALPGNSIGKYAPDLSGKFRCRCRPAC